jgi:hypothetical protein
MEEKSNLQIRVPCQEAATQVAGDWRARGLEGVLTWADKSGKTWL